MTKSCDSTRGLCRLNKGVTSLKRALPRQVGRTRVARFRFARQPFDYAQGRLRRLSRHELFTGLTLLFATGAFGVVGVAFVVEIFQALG